MIPFGMQHDMIAALDGRPASIRNHAYGIASIYLYRITDCLKSQAFYNKKAELIHFLASSDTKAVIPQVGIRNLPMFDLL